MNLEKRNALYFDLDISHDEFLYYYKGAIRNVVVMTTNGVKIQFPARFIQRFVGHDGVHGRFRIVFDENNKLLSLSRIDS